MLPQTKIDEIVGEVATAYLTRENFDRVMSEPAIDSEGEEALRITIVVTAEAVHTLAGDAILETLLNIQQKLRAAGEDRFPIVEWATPDELEPNGDPES